MTNPTKSINDRLLFAQVVIDNTKSDEAIKSAVALFGYDDAKVAVGKALLDSANEMHLKQQKEYGEQYEASEVLKSSRANAHRDYMKFVKIARIALRDNHAAYQKLDLLRERKQSISGWLGQCKQFYINLLGDAELLAKMAEYGITQEKLQTGKELVGVAESANAAQKKEMGEAQQATINRDNKLDELDQWIADYIAIARIALEDTPQYLEKLGIVKK